MTKPETLNKPKLNLMTEFTHSALLDYLNALRIAEKKYRLAIGEAAGPQSDWHDNAAFEEANRLVDVTSGQISQIEQKLRNVQFITPREVTTTIDIGNTVIVKFDAEPDNEAFTILGPDDSRLKPGWISNLSELAQCLIGKKTGDIAEYSTIDVKNVLNHRITIVEIHRGNF